MPAETDPSSGLSPDFQDFITALNEAEVDVVLIGGYALGAHGVVRATGDIDFLYRRTRANVKRLIAAMIEFGAPASVVDELLLLKPGSVTYFGTPPQRIDLLNEIDGVTFAAVWKGAKIAAIGGQKMRIIGLAELRRNKGATGRRKDREDLQKLNARSAGRGSGRPTKRRSP